jgi:D-glycero-D-manno-heptose 1,7-bisphosphate phosphatase
VRPAAFLDRDGTLLEEAGYVDRLERLIFFPFSIDAIRLLNRGGYAVVVVTNQSGVGRGLYPESFVHEAHDWISRRSAEGGARIDAFYFCPHHPSADIEAYRRECDCRKPGPGMFRQAAADLGLDLPRSFVVGDKGSDILAARAAGSTGVLVRTGYGRDTERTDAASHAAAVADDLIAATAWILGRPR